MLRKALLILLTVATLATLALLIASYVGTPSSRSVLTPADMRRAICDDKGPFWDDYKPAIDYWPGLRYTLHVSARRGWLRFERRTNYCLECGGLPPNHRSGCFYRGVVVDYAWVRPKGEDRIAFPGIKWTTYLFFGARYNSLTISLWLLLPLFAAYPLLAFTRGPLRHHHRRRRGLCPQCGYNLTGNESGRCPECGTESPPRPVES